MNMKMIAAGAAALMCASFTGCGDSGSGKSSKGSASASGEYYMMHINGMKEYDDIENLDEAIEDDIDREYMSSVDITLDKKNFEVGIGAKMYDAWYEGKYSVGNDDAIEFEYDSYHVKSEDDEETVFECSEERLEEMEEDLEWAQEINADFSSSEEDFRKAITILNENKRIETMLEMNESGTAPFRIAPPISANDRNEFNIMPNFLPIIGSQKNDDEVVTYKHKGDFLCVDTYGFELDGKYRAGDDFTINYDPIDAMTDFKYSGFYWDGGFGDEIDEEIAQRWVNRYEISFKADDLDTTLEFSDGEWEWYNSEGDLINNGEYLESKDHKGLVYMFTTEDSEIDKETLGSMFFYIDDGEIYYPGFIKVD